MELPKLSWRNVGDGGIAQPVAAPLRNREAVLDERPIGGVPCGPDEQIHGVQPPMIDDRRNGLAVYRIEPSAGKRKAAVGKLGHRRREGDLAVEPWFDDMLV